MKTPALDSRAGRWGAAAVAGAALAAIAANGKAVPHAAANTLLRLEAAICCLHSKNTAKQDRSENVDLVWSGQALQERAVAPLCLHWQSKASAFRHSCCPPRPLTGLFVMLLQQREMPLLLLLMVQSSGLRQSCLHCTPLSSCC
jgi:hypothetical protein